jgi:hypothetical protein
MKDLADEIGNLLVRVYEIHEVIIAEKPYGNSLAGFLL